MDPITFSLIMLGATVGSSLIQNYVQRKSNTKNRASAKSLAMTNRSDTLNQYKVSNALATSRLNQRDIEQNFNSKMLNEYKKDKTKEQSYLLNKTSQDALGITAKNTLGTDNSWLMKSRLQARF
jgi:hypothetical protein